MELTEEVVGRGSWATVYVARFRGLKVAAKCMHSLYVSDYNQQLFAREMSIYHSHHSPSQRHPVHWSHSARAAHHPVRADVHQSAGQTKGLGMRHVCILDVNNSSHVWLPHGAGHTDSPPK